MEIKLIDDWMKMHILIQNYVKCKYMMVNRKHINSFSFKFIITIRESNKHSINYLGAQIDKKLSWKNHVQNLTKQFYL